MPSALTPYPFEESPVRAVLDAAGNMWFIAQDMCNVLGIDNQKEALAALDAEEKGCPVLVDTLVGQREMATISESGLYALAFRSHTPEARAFRQWVTAVALPRLREKGELLYPDLFAFTLQHKGGHHA